MSSFDAYLRTTQAALPTFAASLAATATIESGCTGLVGEKSKENATLPHYTGLLRRMTERVETGVRVDKGSYWDCVTLHCKVDLVSTVGSFLAVPFAEEGEGGSLEYSVARIGE